MLPEIQSQNKSTTSTLNNFKVKNGQKFDDVVKNMTAEEKATVNLFDINSNGVFDGKESEVFNTSVFTLSEGNINICLKDYENTNVEIKYSDLKSLENTWIGHEKLIIPFTYMDLQVIDTSSLFYGEKQEKALGRYNIEKGIDKITLDYKNDFVQINGDGKSTGDATFSVYADSIEINDYKPFRFTLGKQVKSARLNNVNNPSVFAYPSSKTNITKHSSNTEIITTGNTKINIEDIEEIIKLEEEKSIENQK